MAKPIDVFTRTSDNTTFKADIGQIGWLLIGASFIAGFCIGATLF